ncbi:MAG: thioredoxin family protein, partial [Ignavibacteriaceae bacterium]|nr:thioredoxin family protein [Ignavibacteriaceae bacterium]
EIYKGLKNTEVIAVSMDEKKEEWEKFIKENKFNWKDVHETKGWGGKSVEDYYIYATPSMFVLDREKRIVSKPVSVEEVRGMVQ